MRHENREEIYEDVLTEKINQIKQNIKLQNDGGNFYLLLDHLDQGYTKDIDINYYNRCIADLLDAIEDVKDEALLIGINLRVIVFLRDDIFASLSGPNMSKRIDARLSLDWTPDQINNLIARRIISSSGGKLDKDTTFDQAWFSFAEVALLGKDDKPLLVEVIERTSRVPRDYIVVLRALAAVALRTDKTAIDKNCLRSAEKIFGEFFKHEVSDEVGTTLPCIMSTLEIIKSIGKRHFKFSEFQSRYLELIEKFPDLTHSTADKVVYELYKFNILGNFTNKNFRFAYLNKESVCNLEHTLVVTKKLSGYFGLT